MLANMLFRSGILVIFTGIKVIDLVVSFGIKLYVLKEAFEIFLETNKTPKDLNSGCTLRMSTRRLG